MKRIEENGREVKKNYRLGGHQMQSLKNTTKSMIHIKINK